MKHTLPGLLLVIVIGLTLVQCGGVNNGAATPAAFDCNPSTGDVNSFYNSMIAPGTTGLQAQTTSGNTCLGCHGSANGTDFSRKSRFRLNTTNLSDFNVQKEDLCVVYMWGQRSPDQEIVTHPQGTQHDGGQVTADQISSIVTFVQTYRLPSDQSPPTY